MKTTTLLALALSFSFASYAGTFVKEDTGNVSWIVNVNKNQDGTVTISRNGQTLRMSSLSNEDQIRIINKMAGPSLGQIAEEKVVFETTDERTQQTVSDLIIKKLTEELSVLPVEVKSSELEFQYLNCQATGFYKKQLVCSARYKNQLTVDLK